VNFTYQTATTSTSTGSGITSVAPSETIQEPVIESAQVGTTVTVPDGGTILLGGQTIAGESVREAGVPVLDKIPFLKRLFSNHSEAKDEQVLLILVKPTILIQDEVENKQFPTLSTKTGG
jgi:type II secretory pathway component GspD/PulD (secretin)